MVDSSYLSTAISALQQQFHLHPDLTKDACQHLGLDIHHILGENAKSHLAELIQTATQAAILRPDMTEIKAALTTLLGKYNRNPVFRTPQDSKL